MQMSAAKRRLSGPARTLMTDFYASTSTIILHQESPLSLSVQLSCSQTSFTSHEMEFAIYRVGQKARPQTHNHNSVKS